MVSVYFLFTSRAIDHSTTVHPFMTQKIFLLGFGPFDDVVEFVDLRWGVLRLGVQPNYHQLFSFRGLEFCLGFQI